MDNGGALVLAQTSRFSLLAVLNEGDPMPLADTRTEIFRSSWSLYDAIVGMNYMFHREIEAAVRPVFEAGSRAGGYSLLDLGCGNARGLVATLRAAPPRRYLGVDLSRPALDQASDALAQLPFVELREQDMLACVEELASKGERFELIHSAFAVHHLSVGDKARLFRGLAQVLSAGGSVLLVDVVREEGQSREAYLDGYLRMVETEWRALTQEQVAQVREHVASYDHPESHGTLADLAQAAGLGAYQTLGAFRQHHALLFRRTP